MTLHLKLGVIDLPYADAASYKEVKSRKPKQSSQSSITTGDVAEILEDQYHIMEVFFELHGEEIAEKLAEGMVDTIESLELGAPVALDPYGDAMAWAEQRFREFIRDKEMERLGIPGVPTQAAMDGHSHRFKQPYKKRKSRPSFYDTGLFVGAFKSWVEEQ
jgi:hypothetical protein